MILRKCCTNCFEIYSKRYFHLQIARLNNSNENKQNSDKKVLELTGNTKFDAALDRGKTKLFQFMSIYEEAIGLKEIKEAQDNVLTVNKFYTEVKAEKNFLNAQQKRRDLNLKIVDVQQKLRSLREEMERLSRTDSRYLQLFTDEHNSLKEELKLVNEYKVKESAERELFFYLSTSLRNAQEKERARVERIKYLQLGLSILCTSLGILSAYALNYFRNANIREILEYDKEQFKNVNDLVLEIKNRQSNFEANFGKSLSDLDQKIQLQALTILANTMNEPISTTRIEYVQPSSPSTPEPNLSTNPEYSENVYLKIHPYLLSAFVLFGYILFINNK